MELSVAVIIIWKNKVFIPVHSLTDSGLFMQVEPVFTCDLSKEEMIINLQKVREVGHKHVQNLPLEERRKKKDPILQATGAKNWKELAKSGFCYTIGWSEKGTSINMSRLDQQGRWEYDPSKTRKLPFDTLLGDIVQLVLDDFHTRL